MLNTLNKYLSKIGLDGFLIGIILMVVLAYFFPSLGIAKKPISLEELANYGVSGIFFFYGLKLNLQKLKAGLANWKMHILIQSTTFILFPLLVLLIKPLFISEEANQLWMGIFYLASLPSTVSSAVVMVSLANGNVTSAIFNASISSLIGVIVTPIWVGMFMATNTGGFDLQSIVLKLTLQVLLPVLLGMLLNAKLGYLAERFKTALKLFDQSIILTIIYTSFCKSFTENLFQGFSIIDILLLASGMLFLFFSLLFITQKISKLLGFSREDTITVMFCGSKKSLVHGTVMSKILFANASITGILLLPIMLYHALQLIAVSVIARRMNVLKKL